ncbi:MAG TPA: DUF4349 domain-containing protein [Aeromicrobium sp.]|nr:DUF4349 domain-containing protein [Aeromicrobium sp.]
MNDQPKTPVLEAERIEQMRQHVMTQISASAKTDKSAKRRLLLRGAFAGAVAASVLGIAAMGLSGVNLGGTGDITAGVLKDETTSSVESAGRDSIAKDTGASLDEAPFVSTTIVTGSASVQVKNTEKAISQLTRFAAKHGGFIDNESIFDNAGGSAGEVTVRVPQDQVEALRAELNRIGKVQSVDISRADASAQVADVQARIGSLTASIKRLRQIIAESATTKDLLEAEQQLSARQSELESLQAQRRVLLDQTSLASIHVGVSQSESAASVEPSGFTGGLTRGWNALVAATNSVVTFAGMITPWLLPIVLAFGVVLLIRRRLRR